MTTPVRIAGGTLKESGYRWRNAKQMPLVRYNGGIPMQFVVTRWQISDYAGAPLPQIVRNSIVVMLSIEKRARPSRTCMSRWHLGDGLSSRIQTIASVHPPFATLWTRQGKGTALNRTIRQRYSSCDEFMLVEVAQREQRWRVLCAMTNKACLFANSVMVGF